MVCKANCENEFDLNFFKLPKTNLAVINEAQIAGRHCKGLRESQGTPTSRCVLTEDAVNSQIIPKRRCGLQDIIIYTQKRQAC